MPEPDRLPLGGGSDGIRHAPRRSVIEPSHVWYLQAELEQGRHLITTADTSLSFAVVGAGRLGASLALALRAQGALLLGFTAGSPAGRARAETWLGGHASDGLAPLVSPAPQLFVIAVPDQDLPRVAADLGVHLAAAAPLSAVARLEPPVVAHTSGATSVDVLAPCMEAGATALAFHPLQTFSDPLTGSSRFTAAAIAITPSASQPDRPGADFGFSLARLLGARPFLLPDHKRSLYHAAAAFACNYLVTLQHHAEALFIESGLPGEQALSLFLPLVRATFDNIAAQGTVRALTGPLSRGDTGTIDRHLGALRADAPHLLRVYRELGLATLDILRLRGEVDPLIIEELGLLLSPADETPGPRTDVPGT
ncbi:MAG: DUF2520 domain-containing protein [Thermoleophilia bacterium]|nr:DUF2520 domain-containing protein [Thermoleophilia bacterium]